MDTNYGWMFAVDKDLISADKAQDGIRSIELMEARLQAQLPAYRQFTSLDELLVDYEKRLFFSKLPMFVLLVLVAVVVLYYIITLSGLLIERQKGEIALLRSRGAGFWHLISIFTVEGLTISALSIILGPLLAAGAIKLAGSTPIFAELLGGTGLDVKLSGTAYALGAVGGLFSFCALMIPAIQASRMSVTAYRRESARPSGLPFFQKYYIDVLLLILLVVLFRQLTEQGALFASQAFGKTTANYLLLAVPAITLLGFALVLLRLFPVALNLASRILSKILPVGPTLGLWQMARNPAYYARLSLLLILTAGLGIFAASFGGTLDRSFKERVLYSTGSEIRIDGISADASGYTKITFVYIDGAGTLAADDKIFISFSPSGEDGAIPGYRYTFDTSTTDADPGSGDLRLNNGTYASATAIYIDDADADGGSTATDVQTWGGSDSTIKGFLHITDMNDITTYARFKITAAVTDADALEKQLREAASL